MTYDVLDNERHKAVCELRKLPDGYPSYSAFPFAKWYKDLSLALGISALGVSGGELSCTRVRDTLIHLLGGDQMPVTLGDPYGILKGDSGGMDAGGCVETGGGRSDAAADGHMADSAGSQVSEGVAPITTELRNACGSANDMLGYAVIDLHDFDRLCDAIDAAHAGLERENAELRAKLDNVTDSMHDGWVLDVDGVPICVGDVLTDDAEFKSEGKVVRLMLEDEGWMVGIGDGGWSTPSLHEWHHHHVPTVEDVLRELLDEAEHFHSLEEERDAISEYAAKLRLAGDAE